VIFFSHSLSKAYNIWQIKPCLHQPYGSLAIACDWKRKEFARDCRLSYEFAPPYNQSQGGFRHAHFSCDLLMIYLDCTAAVRICTAVVRIRTAAVRTTYEIYNDFGLEHMSLKCCECLAIVARLSYEFVRLSICMTDAPNLSA